MRKKETVSDVLEKIRLDIIDERAERRELESFGSIHLDDSCVIFYEEKNGIKHFIDYEMIQKEKMDPQDFENEDDWIKYENDLKTKSVIPGTFNLILDPKEKYEFTNLKEVLFIVTCLEYMDDDIKVLVTYINLWWQNVTPYKLSQLIGASKQFVSQLLNGQRKIPDKRIVEISKALDFDIREFDWERTKFVFDESDL